MAKIIELEIKNFRGIKSFKENFDQRLVCFVARGDSGKSTILEAISMALSPSWNLSFYDTDFNSNDISKPIEIIVSLNDLPEELITENKFGLFLRGYKPELKVIIDDISEGDEPVLTLKLTVDKLLEPQWSVIKSDGDNGKPINASDRSKLKCFLVADYLDRHFSWDRGNPLYTLLNQDLKSSDKTDYVVDAMRDVKKEIDKFDFEHLTKTMTSITSRAAQFGLDISDTKTTIDFKDLYIKDSRVCLHEDNIPFRMKGKGSKRLASIAIQTAIAFSGGIMLIDEIEQGLEPDRVKQLIRALINESEGQVFITTHSREVITELASENLRFLKNENGQIELAKIEYSAEVLQKVIRACPEAFFVKKIIVCEGATEVGICRAMNQHRIQNDRKSLAYHDSSFIDGSGTNFIERSKTIREAGFEVAVFCDSDTETDRETKLELKRSGIAIFDCDADNSIEKQVFSDIPWNGIVKLVEYVSNAHNKTDEALYDAINSKYSGTLNRNWLKTDTAEVRTALALSSAVKGNEWFKKIYHGEHLGKILFKYLPQMQEKKLGKTLIALSDWVE